MYDDVRMHDVLMALYGLPYELDENSKIFRAGIPGVLKGWNIIFMDGWHFTEKM